MDNSTDTPNAELVAEPSTNAGSEYYQEDESIKTNASTPDVAGAVPDSGDSNPEANDDSDIDEATASAELEKLLLQRQELEEAEEEERQFQLELQKHIEDTKNNYDTYIRWIIDNDTNPNLYQDFCKVHDSEFRINLYNGINEFFNNAEMVNDDVLFYWKIMVVHFLRTSRKYKSSLNDLIFDLPNMDTNLVLVKEKCMFRCYIGEEPLCYFKENGTDYFAS